MTNRWDDEPVGDYDSGTGIRRRWRRSWNNYLAILLGFAGVVLLIGAVPRMEVGATIGGLCVLAASAAVVRADGPKPTMRSPAPRIPTMRAELIWYAVALALVVVGVGMTAV